MKKFYILMIAFPLVIGVFGQGSIFKTSLNPYEQNVHTASYLQRPWSSYNANDQGIKGKTDQHSLIQILDSIYVWQWDTISYEWQISNKITDMVYDQNYNLTSEVYNNWNGIKWEKYMKFSVSYDSNNNQTGYLRQNWIGGSWNNYSQYLYTYNSSNKLTAQLYQRWANNAWENYSHKTFSYNSKNQLTSELFQNWNGSTWQNSSRNIYDYDGNDDCISTLLQVWYGSFWLNDGQYTLSYDENHNVKNELQETWNGSFWENRTFTTFTYDTSNNLTNELIQRWIGNWENSYQWLYTYNASNHMINGIYQKWNISEWDLLWLIGITYDANGFMSSSSYKEWNESGAVTYGDSINYYFHTVLGVNDLKLPVESIVICPNPAYDKISVKVTDASVKSTILKLYNSAGGAILEKKLPGPTTTIDVSTLPDGIYIVKLVNENGVQIGKFVKR